MTYKDNAPGRWHGTRARSKTIRYEDHTTIAAFLARFPEAQRAELRAWLARLVDQPARGAP